MDVRGLIAGGLVVGSVVWMGCIDEEPYGSDGQSPPSGTAASAIVIEAMEGVHFWAEAGESGELHEVITYNGDSGQICMAIRGLSYPQEEGEPTPLGEGVIEKMAASSEPTVDSRTWYIYSAQVSQGLNTDGTEYLYGNIYWDDGSTWWPLVGSYRFSSAELPVSLNIDSDQFVEEIQYVDSGKEMSVTLSSLEPCGFLREPGSEVTTTPAVTETPTTFEDVTPI